MPGLDLPIIPLMAPRPDIRDPKDLQPAIDRLGKAFEEGFISAADIQKRAATQASDIEATREKNKTAAEGARQDRYDMTGAPAGTNAGKVPGATSGGLSGFSTDQLLQMLKGFGGAGM